MTIDEFFAKYLGQPLDFDGYYGDQCMDLFEFYNRDVIGARFAGGNAIDVPNTYDKAKYDWVVNTPNGVPSKGAVIIWGYPIGKYIDDRGIIRYAGHISVFDIGNVYQFTSFDQNWPISSYCHFQIHNWSSVLGWLQPKNTQGTEISVPSSSVSASASASISASQSASLSISASASPSQSMDIPPIHFPSQPSLWDLIVEFFRRLWQ